MHGFIVDMIERFGPRPGGSEAETAAQRHFRQLLASFCHTTHEQPFRTVVRGKFLSLRLYTLGFWAALTLAWWRVDVALLVSAVCALVLLLDFLLYVPLTDVLYRKRESRNVFGDVEPLGDTRLTVILSGHMDSTREFIWWYRLGHWGGPLTVLAVASQLLFPAALAGMLVAGVFALATAPTWAIGLWGIFLVFSPLSIILFSIHGKNTVPGAQDNLSGVAVAYETARALAEQPLQHTRIRVVAFGTEEGGLRGSKAFVKQYGTELLNSATVVINLDGILDAEHVNLITHEPYMRARYCQATLQGLAGTFREHGREPNLRTLPIGATDGAPFARKGIPAVSVVSFSMKRLHFTYHTRHDVPEHVQPEALQQTHQALVRYIRSLDAQA
jgi:hypothetical protein